MKKYLVIWSVLCLILICVSVFIHWDEMVQVIGCSFSGTVDALITGIFSIVFLVMILKMFIP